VIVQRRGIEMLCGRQLFHLLPPLREESGALLPDERCQFIEVIDGFSMWFGVGFIKAPPASRGILVCDLPIAPKSVLTGIFARMDGSCSRPSHSLLPSDSALRRPTRSEPEWPYRATPKAFEANPPPCTGTCPPASFTPKASRPICHPRSHRRHRNAGPLAKAMARQVKERPCFPIAGDLRREVGFLRHLLGWRPQAAPKAN
jgi:hypothetical protein